MYSLTAIVFLTGVGLMALGSLMLLVRAFRWRLVWGLAMLVPVVGLLAFAIVHWKMARNGVLTLILGFLLALAGLWGGADRELGLDRLFLESPVAEKLPVDREKVEALLEKRPGEVEVPNEAEARALGIDTEKSLEEVEAEEAAKPLSEVIPEPSADAVPESRGPKMGWQPVSRKRLEQYLGSPLRVYLLDGKRYEGILERLSKEGNSLTLRRRLSGGEVSYEYPFVKVEWLEVWAPQGTVPAPEEERPAPGEVPPRFLPPGQKPTPPASDDKAPSAAADAAAATGADEGSATAGTVPKVVPAESPAAPQAGVSADAAAPAAETASAPSSTPAGSTAATAAPAPAASDPAGAADGTAAPQTGTSEPSP